MPEKTLKARKTPAAATPKAPKAPKAPTARAIAARIQQQLPGAQTTPLDLSMHMRAGNTTVSTGIGDKLFAGKGTAADLFRSYKNSPHHPSSVLLKYIVHRINNLDEYDQPAPSVDQNFLDWHKTGGAAEKNGHLRIDHLHNWLRLNPDLPAQMLKHRQHLHDLVRQGIGLNLRQINGREYVALARGINQEVMGDEHALASFSDKPSTCRQFGKHIHHVWVPLEDLWYSYDLGPKYPRGEHGPEDEFLVAHDQRRPRYQAEEKDVTALRTRGVFGDNGTVYDHQQGKAVPVMSMDGIVRVPTKGRMLTRTFIAPFADKSSDAEIAAGLEAHRLVLGVRGNLDGLYRTRFKNYSDRQEDAPVTMPGPRTLAVLLHDTGGVTADSAGAPWMPREHARSYMESFWQKMQNPDRDERWTQTGAYDPTLPSNFLNNPNLNADDLHWFIDHKAQEGWHAPREETYKLPGEHVDLLMKHPALDGSHIERIYQLGRETYRKGRDLHREALLAHEAYRNALRTQVKLSSADHFSGALNPGKVWAGNFRMLVPSGYQEIEPLWLRFDAARRAARQWRIDMTPAGEWQWNEPFRRMWDRTLPLLASNPKTPSKVLHDMLDMHLADTKLLASQVDRPRMSDDDRESTKLGLALAAHSDSPRVAAVTSQVPTHELWNIRREGIGTQFSYALGHEFGKNTALTPEHVAKLWAIYDAEPFRKTDGELLGAFGPVAKRLPVPEAMWRQWMQEEPKMARGLLAEATHMPPALRRELLTTVPKRGEDAGALISATIQRKDLTQQELDAIAETASKIDPDLSNENAHWLHPRATIAGNLLRYHSSKLSAPAVVKVAEILSNNDWSGIVHELPLESLQNLQDALHPYDRPHSKDHPLTDKLWEVDDVLRSKEDPHGQTGGIVLPLPHEAMKKAEFKLPERPEMSASQVATKIKAQTVKQRRETKKRKFAPYYDAANHDELAKHLMPQEKAVSYDMLIGSSIRKLADHKGTADLLYRNYKHTPHSVPSLFLKYAVHRINHLHEYEDLGLARAQDEDFLKLHQRGGAAEKNGHVVRQHLHELLDRNPQVPEYLIRAQRRLHAYVLGGCGLNVRTINGQHHVALTRGLNEPTMEWEHALSSWGDIRHTGFGTYQHHAWVPLKDVWFTFEAAPEDVRGNFGHENEWLVSNTLPRYQAEEKDVRPSHFQQAEINFGMHDFPLTGPSGWEYKGHPISPLHLHAHGFDAASDSDIARSLVAKVRWGLNADDLDRLYIGPNAGAQTFEALRKLYADDRKRPQLPAWMWRRSFTPREAVMDAYRTGLEQAAREGWSEDKQGYTAVGIRPGVALTNPNLSADDLIELMKPVKEGSRLATSTHTYVPLRPFVEHPGYSEKVAHALYDHVERNGGTNTDPDVSAARWGHENIPHHDGEHEFFEMIANERTHQSVVNRFLKRVSEMAPVTARPGDVMRSYEAIARNPNHTPEQVGQMLESLRRLEDRPDFRSNPDVTNPLYYYAKLSQDEIERLWTGDDPRNARARSAWLSHNLHVPEQEMLRAAQSAWSSSTMQALVPRAGLPANVQRKLWERMKTERPNYDDSADVLRWLKRVPYSDELFKLARHDAIDPQVADEMADAALARMEDDERSARGGDATPSVHSSFPDSELVRALIRNESVPAEVKRKLLSGTKKRMSLLSTLLSYEERKAILGPQDAPAPAPGPGPGHVILPLPVEPEKVEKHDVERAIAMCGGLDLAFEAAEFLSGRTASDKAERAALKKYENDVIGAALAAHGLTDDAAGRRALSSVLKVYSLEKFEGIVRQAPRIEAAFDSSSEVANWIKRAYQEGGVRTAVLNGKHSKGALIAHVNGDVFLLKPGSGSQSPAAGAREETASQSQREVAFWRIADAWGVGDQMPRADLVLINGKEYAAIHMLALDYKNLGIKAHEEKGLVPKCLEPYRSSGMLHKWAIIDWVLGNTDRHSQNMMISSDDKTVRLIDHGSAFAGETFDPAGDDDSFIPYYLRAWTDRRFSEMAPDERVRLMPTAGHAAKSLRAWVQDLSADKLRYLCGLFNIKPEPSLDRLALVKDAANAKEPVDQAVNRLWAGA
jgi:hypothetical protein